MKNKLIYDRLELDGLINNEYNCIFKRHITRKIELEAKYSKDVDTGIREALRKGLNKFDYSLNGILLDFRRLSIVGDQFSGRIVGRYGEFLVTIKGDFIVFDPKIGSHLQGVVNAKSESHIGCLVHKCFNAMIFRSENEKNWDSLNIQIGEKIIFSIVDHVISANIPRIQGVLAPQFIEQKLEKNKKTSKVLDKRAPDFKENGEISTKIDRLKEDSKTNLEEVDSSKLTCKKLDNNKDLTEKSLKSKSKTKKNVSTVASNVETMDLDKLKVKMKKKKKHRDKDKEKNENVDILETEKDHSSHIASSAPEENPPSVISVKATKEGEPLTIKKKKKDKKKGLEHPYETEEKFVGPAPVQEINLTTDNEIKIMETAGVKKKKKKDKENHLEKAENLVGKSKEKKKRDRKNSTDHLVKAAEQVSPSEKNKLPDNIETDINSENWIEELMSIRAADVILRSEPTPVKGTSVEYRPNPKQFVSDEDRITRGESSSPRKKMRGDSFTEKEITLQSTGMKGLEGSPSKKRRLEKSAISSKSNNSLEKSLFSDLEDNVTSPKRLPSSIALKEAANSDKLTQLNVTNTLNDAGKKGKKRKILENQSEKEKLEKGSCHVKGGSKYQGSVMTSLVEKEDKDLGSEKSPTGKKSVTSTSASILSPERQSKTTLIQRFQECMGKPSETPSGETVITAGEADETTKGLSKSEGKESKKIKKSKTKLDDSSRLSFPMQSKSFTLDGLDMTQLNHPVKTSTPKGAENPEDLTGKSKEPIKKTVKVIKRRDKECKSMIEALMAQTLKGIGFQGPMPFCPSEKVRKETMQETLSKWIGTGKSTKSSKKNTSNVTDSGERLGSADSGFNSNAEKHKV